MWEEEVAPELLRRHPGTVLVTRTLKTTGMGEPLVDETLSPLLKSTNPSIGIYARPDGVHVRLGAKAPTQEEAWALIEPLEAQIRALLGSAIWGTDKDTFMSTVGRMLDDLGLTLAVMESCTGGLFGDEITNVPGASKHFRGGIISYDTDVKVLMGVDPATIEEHGVVSDETAAAMAAAVRDRLGADIGIGITGVAGPEPQDGKPVGEVHIALNGGGRVPDQSTTFVFAQGREQIKRRAVTQATMLLRRALLAAEAPLT
jgi:nicotinamide-nucleotide amidase